jgi:hypothetical protein
MKALKISLLLLALMLLSFGYFHKGAEFVKIRASFLCTSCVGLDKGF